jgi:hypothetical protein
MFHFPRGTVPYYPPPPLEVDMSANDMSRFESRRKIEKNVKRKVKIYGSKREQTVCVKIIPMSMWKC